MFTDGLDHTALQWVREGLETPRAVPPPLENISPNLPKELVYTSQSKGKGWDLPPTQLLHNVHFHSDYLRPTFGNPITKSNDELEESVGSISEKAFNQGYEDFSDTLDEQDSGDYSVDSSPGGSLNNGQRLPRDADLLNYDSKCQAKKSTSGSVSAECVEQYYVQDKVFSNSSYNRASNDSVGQFESRVKQTWPRQHLENGRNEFEKDYDKLKSRFADGNQHGWERDNSDDESTIKPVVRSSGHETVCENLWRDQVPGNLDDCRPLKVSVKASTGSMQHKNFFKDVEDSKILHSPLQTADNSISQGHLFPSFDCSQMDPIMSCRQHNPRKQNNTSGASVEEAAERSQSDGMGLPPTAPPMLASMVLDNNSEDNTQTSGVKAYKQTIHERAQNYSGLVRPSAQNPTYRFEAEQKSSETLIQSETCTRSNCGVGAEEVGASSRQTPCNTLPSVYLSGQAAWQAVIAYDACVRLCLGAWARGCVEAPEFLQNECCVLRNSFGLQQLLLQPHEEAMRTGQSDQAETASAAKPKRNVGKIKVQVRKLKIMPKIAHSACKFPSLETILSHIPWHADSLDRHPNKRSSILAGWDTVRKIRVIPRDSFRRTLSQRNNAYLTAGAQYMKQVSGLLKAGVNTLRNSALTEVPQETFSCLVRLKSSTEDEAVRMQPGSSETLTFHPESTGDDLFLDVHDSKGNLNGRVVVQLASVSDDTTDRVRWWSVYREPEHECVGKVQLFISYTMTSGELGAAKWGAVGETVAYDIVLEVALKVQKFQRRNLQLQGSWRWLLSEFASFYGVSDAYTKLRYLACIMDAATPTEDCLVLIHNLLVPIIKARDENSLDRQEKRILGEVEEQVSQLLALVFENYKSLDDSSPSGLSETFVSSLGSAAPALLPAVQIFTLLHDVLSLEAQTMLRNYFQTAARKRCKRHMAETDEFVSSSNEGFLMDPLTLATAYLKMKNLCLHIREEVRTDIAVHNQLVLPSSIDLPNITAKIYNVELCNRLRTFLVACPPSSPSPPVTDLLISTADFQRDLVNWSIRPMKGGVDAKDLFHLYIVLWIQDKRLQLLEYCKLDKVRLTGIATPNGVAPFVEEIYERIKDTLNEYEVIVGRWPEYTFVLENAITDVERAIIIALEKHYADVLVPLKDVMVPKKFGLQYMQKLTQRRSILLYSVPNQLGVVLNTIKRLLDTLRPKMETQMKLWVACLPVDGSAPGRAVFGERLNEVTVALRAKYKSFLQAIVEKLADNRTTKLKKILQDTKEAAADSELRERMQPLTTQLLETISHLHEVFTTRVFVAVCRGYWDRMAQDVLQLLENRKENRSWYKSSCFILGIMDDIFASQMQRLQGHALQEKDLEPPRSVMEARSMLSKDARNGVDSSNYMFF
ncbi:hypothetical protein O6H91_08G065300 [Diphasiastrum complanatum]|uniref:Uncharacterized protein n=1 Tax=Diphasiastrum complanatum TaxID=34168 RepID=A0ACC2CYC4_DIPCM|nr:hypothetical protein O6H91_08G065300 [Diphasiastrum complanatum]